MCPKWRPNKTEVIKIRCTKKTKEDFYKMLSIINASTAEDGLAFLLDLFYSRHYDVRRITL